MQERKKILWLVSWYPNKYNPFDGDFIQRHAKAAALFHDVHVLFVKPSERQMTVEEVLYDEGGVTEQILYIPKKRGLKSKLQNVLDWQRYYKSLVKQLIEKERPSFVHVHVPWKVGLVALWAKKKFGIPFIVTEHWGIYNNVVDDNIHTKSLLVRQLLKRIYNEATVFASVSSYVGEGVNKTLVKKNFHVIPNVVDTSLFFPLIEKYNRFTFIHVSNMVPLKNVEGILAAFQNFLVQTNADAQLVLVGNKDTAYELFAQKLGLLNVSVFRGEIPYPQVASQMQRSHVFVLNSNIENSPCVIGEALCCGLPVIATNVGGIPELVDQNNALLVSANNADALTQAMRRVYENFTGYQPDEISALAKKKFSPVAVGKLFSALYCKPL